MKWRIPAKTFLLGEYAALEAKSALILTTKPCFEITLCKGAGSNPFHPASPASRLWMHHIIENYHVQWQDPYKGLGGLGASSAEFLGVFLSVYAIEGKPTDVESMLQAYYQHAWSKVGVRPSGYDVIAQMHSGCVYINRHRELIKQYPWPFLDLDFILLHTGKKLATHTHLESSTFVPNLDELSDLAEEGLSAFENNNSEALISATNAYHEALKARKLVAPHTLDLIQDLKKHPEILAMKGCGAMGADVVLLLIRPQSLKYLLHYLKINALNVLATSKELCES